MRRRDVDVGKILAEGIRQLNQEAAQDELAYRIGWAIVSELQDSADLVARALGHITDPDLSETVNVLESKEDREDQG